MLQLLCLFLGAGQALSLPRAAAPVVHTSWGPITGQAGEEEKQFLGIPFALPPVGPLRWQSPLPWNQTYEEGGWDGTHFRAACMQDLDLLVFDVSEDCLYLDVFSPLDAKPTSKLPVMLWIYGGSFTNGAGSQFTYNGTTLAADFDVLVVNLNYRLGALGFAAMWDGSGDETEPLRANFGLQDQREAMRWVRDNIEAFGGDPTRVTIFGESAGAMSVQLHLLLSESKGLFHGAISQSGMPSAQPRALALSMTERLANHTDCPTQQPEAELCLRGKTGRQIIRAQEQMGVLALYAFAHSTFAPCIDLAEFHSDPKRMVQNGEFASTVPVLAGSNTNEGNLFVEASFPLHFATKEHYKEYIQTVAKASQGVPFNDTTFAAILDHYPPVSGNNFNIAAQLATDVSFACGTTSLLSSLAAVADAPPVFLYHFDHEPFLPLPGLGVYHASELPFVFDIGPYEPAGVKFSQSLGQFWTNFAATGDPNGMGDALWPALQPGSQVGLVLDTDFVTELDYRKPFCEFWATTI